MIHLTQKEVLDAILAAARAKAGPGVALRRLQVHGKYKGQGETGLLVIESVDVEESVAPLIPNRERPSVANMTPSELCTLLEERIATLSELEQRVRTLVGAPGAFVVLPPGWRVNPTAEKPKLCDDCPREGYPTDATRCKACPRRLEPRPIVETGVWECTVEDTFTKEKVTIKVCAKHATEAMFNAMEAAAPALGLLGATRDQLLRKTCVTSMRMLHSVYVCGSWQCLHPR